MLQTMYTCAAHAPARIIAPSQTATDDSEKTFPERVGELTLRCFSHVSCQLTPCICRRLVVYEQYEAPTVRPAAPTAEPHLTPGTEVTMPAAEALISQTVAIECPLPGQARRRVKPWSEGARHCPGSARCRLAKEIW